VTFGLSKDSLYIFVLFILLFFNLSKVLSRFGHVCATRSRFESPQRLYACSGKILHCDCTGDIASPSGVNLYCVFHLPARNGLRRPTNGHGAQWLKIAKNVKVCTL